MRTQCNATRSNLFQLGILRYFPADEPDKKAKTEDGSENDSIRTNRVWVDGLPLVATRSGVAMPTLGAAPQTFYVTQFCVGDRVLGVVKKKTGELCYLDIGCPSPACLNVLSFEGASKKNRPDIRLRDVIYASISQADPGMLLIFFSN